MRPHLKLAAVAILSALVGGAGALWANSKLQDLFFGEAKFTTLANDVNLATTSGRTLGHLSAETPMLVRRHGPVHELTIRAAECAERLLVVPAEGETVIVCPTEAP